MLESIYLRVRSVYGYLKGLGNQKHNKGDFSEIKLLAIFEHLYKTLFYIDLQKKKMGLNVKHE